MDSSAGWTGPSLVETPWSLSSAVGRGAIAALLSGSLVGGVGACGVPGGDAGAPSTTEPASDENDGIDDPVTTEGALRGYWVWEQRVQGTGVQSGDVDRGQMKVAFGDGNDRCHWRKRLRLRRDTTHGAIPPGHVSSDSRRRRGARQKRLDVEREPGPSSARRKGQVFRIYGTMSADLPKTPTTLAPRGLSVQWPAPWRADEWSTAMAISMNPANLAAAQAFLRQVGMSVDPQSSRGVQVSVDEANKISAAFDAIPDAGTRKTIGAALLSLIQADVFEVPSKTAQAVIAKVVGKPTDQVFTARDKAELVGGASIKSVAQATLGLLSKIPTLDKGMVEKLTKGLDAIPPEAKNMVLAVLNKAGKEGEVKFAADARAPFTKAFAKAEATSQGAVSKMEQNFETKGDGPMEYFASQMANSPFFEDRLAALMFMICAKTMKQVDEDLRSLDDTVKRDNTKGPNKPGATGGKPATGVTGPATGQTGQINPGQGQGKSPTQQLRTSYESVVQSAAAHRSDDGIITEGEAKALVGKLDAISPPEAKLLQAEAMGRAILATGGGQVLPEMKPLADWAEKATGKKLTEMGDAKALYEAKSPLAQTIGGSDKLENKVAAFIVEGVFGEGKAPKMQAVMNEMKPLFSAMEQQVTGKTVEEAKLEQPKTSQHSQNIEDRFGRIAEAVKTGKIPVTELGNVAKSMVDRLPIPGDKKAIFDGITAGLTAIAGDKNIDVKSVFSKAVGPAVETIKKDTPALETAVGKPVDDVRKAVSGALYEAKDSGKALGTDAAMAVLDKSLGDKKQALLQNAKAAGYDDGQLQALGAAFDHEAQPLRDELKSTGQLEPGEPKGFGKDSVDPTGTGESRSRQIMFETLKLKMTRLSEMMQAMSNILNALHQTAENAIRAIR